MDDFQRKDLRLLVYLNNNSNYNIIEGGDLLEALAIKYRPREFEDVCGQTSLVKILERQVEIGSFKNCILLQGPSGTGKTTLARIFANKINKGKGEPIEVDGASNNGVDNIRIIIDSAIERSLDSEYKVFIIDECHMITTQGWNAFLKCIEEPPKYTIFIFCTTDPQKIPQTIINRCQVHRLGRLSNELIKDRLEYICKSENFSYGIEALDYISKLSQGGMRQAISYLDKCKDYSTVISLENVVDCLGNYTYDTFFNLTNAYIDGNREMILACIDDLYYRGSDLKLFISKYLEFILQVVKYLIVKDINLTTIPSHCKDQLDYLVNIEDNVKYFNSYMNKILEIKKEIRGDSDIKTTFEVMLLKGGE